MSLPCHRDVDAVARTCSPPCRAASRAPRPGRGAAPNPLIGAFRTSDGRHIQLVLLQGDRYWAGLCELLGRPDLAADPRFADMASRRGEHGGLRGATKRGSSASAAFAECKELLSGIDAPWAPLQAVEELLDDPQVIANGYIGTVSEDGLEYRLPAVPVQIDERPPPMRRAPEHGEHTEAVLVELGYTWDEISALREAGVLS